MRAAVQLRSYKIGQYNGEYMSSIEGEERLKLERDGRPRFSQGSPAHTAMARLCSSENMYPAAGAGIQYVLKPKERIVLNLEYAQGDGDNHGVYLKMGYAY